MRTKLMLLCLAVSILLIACSNSSKLDKAEKLFEHGQNNKAQKIVNEVMENDPENGRAYYLSAMFKASNLIPQYGGTDYNNEMEKVRNLLLEAKKLVDFDEEMARISAYILYKANLYEDANKMLSDCIESSDSCRYLSGYGSIANNGGVPSESDIEFIFKTVSETDVAKRKRQIPGWPTKGNIGMYLNGGNQLQTYLNTGELSRAFDNFWPIEVAGFDSNWAFFTADPEEVEISAWTDSPRCSTSLWGDSSSCCNSNACPRGRRVPYAMNSISTQPGNHCNSRNWVHPNDVSPLIYTGESFLGRNCMGQSSCFCKISWKEMKRLQKKVESKYLYPTILSKNDASAASSFLLVITQTGHPAFLIDFLLNGGWYVNMPAYLLRAYFPSLAIFIPNRISFTGGKISEFFEVDGYSIVIENGNLISITKKE